MGAPSSTAAPITRTPASQPAAGRLNAKLAARPSAALAAQPSAALTAGPSSALAAQPSRLGGIVPRPGGGQPLRRLALIALLMVLFPATLACPGQVAAAEPSPAAPAAANGSAARGSASGPGASSAAGVVVIHNGPCNASTALSMGEGLFVVADDEASAPVKLRLYRSGQAGDSLGSGEIPERAVAPQADGHLELDLEGSARIGPLVYWIGSHGAAEADGKGDQGDKGRKGDKGEKSDKENKGANKAKDANIVGEPRPNRRRLFATNLGLTAAPNGKGMAITVQPVGRPYSSLIEDLAADRRYADFKLAAAALRPAKASDGLNIEGLAATPSGTLLIGFRNPLPGGKSLVAPLSNPNGVMGGDKAVFADPVLLDLGGLGIRSLEMVNGSLLIVAGPAEGNNKRSANISPSALYRWSGKFEQPAERLRTFTPLGAEPLLNPEALLRDGDSLVLLSDDGKLDRDGLRCEELPKGKQRFRELRMTPLP